MGCYKVGTGEDNIVCSCPLAPWQHESGTDKHPGCSIKVEPSAPSVFYCWSCHEKGTLTHLVRKLSTLSRDPLHLELLQEVEKAENGYVEAALSDAANLYAPKPLGWKPPTAPKSDPMLTPEDLIFPESEIEELVGGVNDGFLDLGFSLDTCRRWGLGYDEFGHRQYCEDSSCQGCDPRTIFPIRDLKGNLVGCVGRAIHKWQAPPYKNYWNFKKSQFLYGEHLVDRKDPRPLLVVEGPTDTLWTDQTGVVRVLGQLGSSLSRVQADKIEYLADGRLVIGAFDNDKAGDKSWGIFQEQLLGRVPLLRMGFPEGCDPRDLEQDALRELVMSMIGKPTETHA